MLSRLLLALLIRLTAITKKVWTAHTFLYKTFHIIETNLTTISHFKNNLQIVEMLPKTVLCYKSLTWVWMKIEAHSMCLSFIALYRMLWKCLLSTDILKTKSSWLLLRNDTNIKFKPDLSELLDARLVSFTTPYSPRMCSNNGEKLLNVSHGISDM